MHRTARYLKLYILCMNLYGMYSQIMLWPMLAAATRQSRWIPHAASLLHRFALFGSNSSKPLSFNDFSLENNEQFS